MLLPRSWRQTSHDLVHVHPFAILKLLSTVPYFPSFRIFTEQGISIFALLKKKKKQQPKKPKLNLVQLVQYCPNKQQKATKKDLSY